MFTFVFKLLSACTLKRGALFQALCLIPKITIIGRAPPALHLKSYIIAITYVIIYSSLIMKLRSSPGGVKVSTLPGKPEVSGSIPES